MVAKVKHGDLAIGDYVQVRIDRISGSGNPVTDDGLVHVNDGADHVGDTVLVRINESPGGHFISELVERDTKESIYPRYQPRAPGSSRISKSEEWKGPNKNKLLRGHL